MALSVPLSRFTPRVGGGSAFFVRPHRVFGFCRAVIRCDGLVSSQIAVSKFSGVSLVLACAGSRAGAVLSLGIYERFDSPMFVWDRHVDVA